MKVFLQQPAPSTKELHKEVTVITPENMHHTLSFHSLLSVMFIDRVSVCFSLWSAKTRHVRQSRVTQGHQLPEPRRSAGRLAWVI